jgi:hypothetical protein
MGIQDYIQEFDRIGTIHIGVWTRSNGSIRIFGTQSSRRNNHKYDRKRRSKRKVKSTYGTGRKHDFGRTPLKR